MVFFAAMMSTLQALIFLKPSSPNVFGLYEFLISLGTTVQDVVINSFIVE